MLKAIMFGAGGNGTRLYEVIKERYEIVGIVDNDKKKWGRIFHHLEVEEPEECLSSKAFDVVVLTSAPGKDSIIEQLQKYGVDIRNVDVSFVMQPLESRRVFLKNFLELYGKKYGGGVDASVAEAGVFQGDFAKYVNAYAPNRKLFLFDTWEGFDSRDIAMEKSEQFSSAEENDYNNASVEMVLQKMPYPSQCVVRAGYFPESAVDIGEKFCFANLDLDLYKPTLEGLKWFEERMVTGGIILVHDYFSDTYRGVKRAVDEYMEDTYRQELFLLPIGDGISVAVCGF